MKPYDPRGCQSLFGYAEKVHERSGGICEYCEAGKGHFVRFDEWRQLTVEHIIGESQGGYLRQIQKILRERFPQLTVSRLEELATTINERNTKTACRFCNSMTSRHRHSRSMDQMLAAADNPDEAVQLTIAEIDKVFQEKYDVIRHKMKAVKAKFDKKIKLALLESRPRR